MNTFWQPFTAVVLAGGRSTRMGCDKAGLRLADGRTLLERQLDLVRSAGASEVLVSARPDQMLAVGDAQRVHDLQSDAGPLAGIASALAAARYPQVLVLAVDLGHMTSGVLGSILAFAEAGGGLVPLLDDRVEPLAALYPREAAALAASALAAGERRPRHWARQLVGLGLARWWPAPSPIHPAFANWNTPADLERPPAD